MKKKLRILSGLVLSMFSIAVLTPPARASVASGKKGIGLSESKGFSQSQLEALKVAWYYNWGAKTKITTTIPFIPMIFSKRMVDEPLQADVVLGFNEPDNSKQSNMSVEEALKHWPSVVEKAKRIGGPAMAGNPVTGDWLPQFMLTSPKVDFVTVHWYKGIQSKKFIKDLEAIHSQYKKPIWVTEFAPQTAGSSREQPGKFKQKDVDTFIQESVGWMEKTPFIERYAWHDSKVGTSALFDEKGQLTATGRTYAAQP
ncbi:hypothetical protein EBR21_01755 [bacterium]|nr:hypothetical protein [bacterium]